jgi:hypothetical protein
MAIFYADNSGSGVVYRERIESWAQARAGTDGDAVFLTGSPIQIIQSWTSGGYHPIRRAFFTFDTSSIPADATITGAALKIYGDAVTANNNSSSAYVVESTQASATALANADYDQVGSVSLANAIAYASWNTSGYNVFTLNATGLALINTSGYTKLALRDGRDFNNTGEATTNNAVQAFLTDATSDKDPYLEVTYSVPNTTNALFFGAD